VEADCGGSRPTVDCPCCTTCCYSGDGEQNGCTSNVTAICSVRASWLLETEPTTTCQCTEDGADLFCTDAQCESHCSTVAAIGGREGDAICFDNASFGYTFNVTSGAPVSFQTALEIVLPAAVDVIPSQEGRFSPVFEDTEDDDSCAVYWNDEKCRHCTRVFCDDQDILTGYDVVCDNVADIVFSRRSFSTCTDSGSWLYLSDEGRSCARPFSGVAHNTIP
jgi:hypothetical protein